MTRTVTAVYDTDEEAREALIILKGQVRPLEHADVYDRSLDKLEALQELDLSREELAACRVKLATGGYLLLVLVPDGGDPQAVVSVLERISEGDLSPSSLASAQSQTASSQATPTQAAAVTAQAAPSASAASASPVAEQAPPAEPEEQVRTGERELLRGGVTVKSRSRTGETPRLGEAELMEELVRVENRPASRLISEEELEQAGLLRDRTIEIVETREEPVIEKQAFVREEVVIKKAVEERVEQVHDTVRRTEVEVERTGAARGSASDANRLETLERNHGR